MPALPPSELPRFLAALNNASVRLETRLLIEWQYKQTRFSSRHFLRSRSNDCVADIPPASYCSVIHEGVHSYILTPTFP